MIGLHEFPRRSFLQLGIASMTGAALNGWTQEQNKEGIRNKLPATQFQIACMTLPYSQYPFERALTGIKSAGYKYVAWGTTHKEVGEPKGRSIISADARPDQAKVLGQRCRDLGLEPLMMFSGIYPEDPKGIEGLTARILQAEAAGIPQVLTFGHTKGPNRQVWVQRFKQLGPVARDHGVTIVVKQHGETGQLTGEIVNEVADPGIQVNYDAGNVMDYTKGKVNPLDDIKTCAEMIRSFCIKDHRMFPMDQDCGPGFGEIDHYRLLHTVAFTGRKMPMCCENISAPKFRPSQPEEIDGLARRAREFLEMVVHGLQA